MRLILTIILLLSSCTNEEAHNIYISIKNHKFEPEIITAPPMKKIKIHVANHDSTPEEFESLSLKREKLIPPKSTSVIVLAPLKQGEYNFFGEFHQDTAKGKIIVGNND